MVSTVRRCKLNVWLLFLMAVLLPLMSSGRPVLAACLYAARAQTGTPAEEAPEEDGEVLNHLVAVKSVAPRHRRFLIRAEYFVPLHPAASYSLAEDHSGQPAHLTWDCPLPPHDYLVGSLTLRGPPASL